VPRATIRTLPAHFEDARFDIDEMFGSDDRVVVRWTLHATHTEPFAGLSPTQKKAVVRELAFIAPRWKDHGNP
jgi:hypothetical protein